MGLEQFGFDDVSLIDGETIDSALPIGRTSGDNPEVVLLTDRRVIYIRGNGSHRKATFASIHDVEAVEITQEREGGGAFIWAGLAFVVAVLLYIVVDQAFTRIAASIVVAMMGVYLLVDQLFMPGKPLLIFKAGSSQVQFGLKGEPSSPEVYEFINRLFRLKEANSPSNGGRFAPR